MKKLFPIILFLFTLTTAKAQSGVPKSSSQEVHVSISIPEFMGYAVNRPDTTLYRYASYSSMPKSAVEVYGNLPMERQVYLRKRDASNKSYQVTLVVTPK